MAFLQYTSFHNRSPYLAYRLRTDWPLSVQFIGSVLVSSFMKPNTLTAKLYCTELILMLRILIAKFDCPNYLRTLASLFMKAPLWHNRTDASKLAGPALSDFISMSRSWLGRGSIGMAKDGIWVSPCGTVLPWLDGRLGMKLDGDWLRLCVLRKACTATGNQAPLSVKEFITQLCIVLIYTAILVDKELLLGAQPLFIEGNCKHSKDQWQSLATLHNCLALQSIERQELWEWLAPVEWHQALGCKHCCLN